MDEKIREEIRNNHYLYSYLREDSYQYKYLYRNKNYIKEIEKKSKEKYQLRVQDKVERIKDKINWLNTIISAIE